jgi:ribosomal protein S18 acetylase RimI-like enzyme
MPVAWGRISSDYSEVFRVGAAVEGGCVAPEDHAHWACADHHIWPATDVGHYEARLAEAFRGRPYCPLCQRPSADIVRPGHEDRWADELRAGTAVAVADGVDRDAKRICLTCGHRWNPVDESVPDHMWFFERTSVGHVDPSNLAVAGLTRAEARLVRDEIEADPQPFVEVSGLLGQVHALLLTSPGATVFAARYNGALVGYLSGQLGPRGVAHGQVMAVRRESRGLGVGVLLWQAFTGFAAGNGAHEYRAVVDPDNFDAIDFHVECGAHPVLVKDFAGPKRDRVVLSVALPVAGAGGSIVDG